MAVGPLPGPGTHAFTLPITLPPTNSRWREIGHVVTDATTHASPLPQTPARGADGPHCMAHTCCTPTCSSSTASLRPRSISPPTKSWILGAAVWVWGQVPGVNTPYTVGLELQSLLPGNGYQQVMPGDLARGLCGQEGVWKEGWAMGSPGTHKLPRNVGTLDRDSQPHHK